MYLFIGILIVIVIINALQIPCSELPIGTAATVICNAFFDGINSFYYAKLERI